MNGQLKNVKKTNNGQEYVASRTLKKGTGSTCEAVFFRNKHKNSNEYIVSLKIARYKKQGNNYSEKPEKSITLSSQELDELIKYIQEYYSPLNTGMTEFISVDEDIAKLFSRIRTYKISEEEIVDKLISSGVLTDNLSVAIYAAERNNAISELEDALLQDYPESFWQAWFEKNKWVLGSDYINILPERDIDVRDIADYLMKSVDGFLDVVEIKKPNLPFWTKPDSHGNICPTSQLTAAITQCQNYLYRIELQSNSIEFQERVNGTKTVKPQCMLVYGRSNDWSEAEAKALRILNASYHQIHIITYDQLLLRARQVVGDCALV